VLHDGGSLPGSAGYTYDAAGNRTSKTAVQEASPNPVSVTSNYSYDPIYELTQAVVGGTLAESYSYDPVGNRLTSAGSTSFNYNASNELTSTSAATYTYDSNGNTLSKTDTNGTTSYSWDFENRLTSVTLPGTGGTVYFTYDPFGRRIRKVFGSATTIYAYDGGNITEELGGGGNLLAHYTQGPDIDEPMAITGGGGTYFYHADGLGSISSLTDGVGNLAVSYVYDSFGNQTASTGTIANPFQYTAREFDSETGLYYYRARYYDPASGRFLGEDPLSFSGSRTNSYAYGFNSPVNLEDPTGLTPACTKQAVFDCAKKLFNVLGKDYVETLRGKTGKFEGETSDGRSFTLSNDAARFSTDDLTAFRDHGQGIPAGANEVVGLTSNTWHWAVFRWYSGFDYHTSYTANDLYPSRTTTTQWHELGHQLAREVGKVDKNFEDEDVWGGLMEQCVSQRLAELVRQLTKQPH